MENDTTATYRRRAEDKVMDMLGERIDRVESALEQHVKTCAAQQQKVMWGLISVLGGIGWLVLKSLPIFASVAK